LHGLLLDASRLHPLLKAVLVVVKEVAPAISAVLHTKHKKWQQSIEDAHELTYALHRMQS
jgi:hypothetical protein